MDDILTQLCQVEEQRESMIAEAAALREQLESTRQATQQLEQQLLMLKANQDALNRLSLDDLKGLEETLDTSLREIRTAIMQRHMADVQRRALSESQTCSLCLEQMRGIVFNCGHQSCFNCSEKLIDCPFCRTKITAKIKLFDS